MLSNLLDCLGYGGLTYGAYVFGGRGAAGFVGGFCFLLLSYSVSSSPAVSMADRLRAVVGRKPAELPAKVHRDHRTITNDVLTEDLQAQQAVALRAVGDES